MLGIQQSLNDNLIFQYSKQTITREITNAK